MMTFKYGALSGLTRELPRVFIIDLIQAELTLKKENSGVLQHIKLTIIISNLWRKKDRQKEGILYWFDKLNREKIAVVLTWSYQLNLSCLEGEIWGLFLLLFSLLTKTSRLTFAVGHSSPQSCYTRL